MSAVRELVLSLAACAIICSLAALVAGNGIFGRLTRLVGGVLMVLILLRSLTGSDWGDIESLLRGFTYSDESLKKTEDEEVQRLIQRSYNAYISSRAEELGLDCEARVVFSNDSTTPVSVEVYYGKRPGMEKVNALKTVIADELGIPAEAQKHAIEGS